MKIKVLTYNIHKGYTLGGLKYVLHLIKKSLHETSADLIFLQEVVGNNNQNKSDQLSFENQFEYLADKIWPHYSYAKNALFSDYHHGNAILSQFPIKFEKHTSMTTNKYEQRGLLHCEIIIPQIEKKIHLYNVHLDLLKRGRLIQYHKISQLIFQDINAHDSFIMAGDFNDWSGELHKLFVNELHLDEAHTNVFSRPARSFPSFYPFLSLDRIYSKNLNLIYCQSLYGKPWDGLSDHVPLLAVYDI